MKEVDIKTGQKEHVYVTCYSGPGNFFCQLAKTSSQLDELMDKLEEFYRPLGDGQECPTNPQVGDTCCAMFTEDDGWYRALVTRVTGTTVEVRYLDYGNTEELPLSRIKRLLPCFAEMCAQAFPASIVGDVADKGEKLRAAIDGKEVMVRAIDKKSSGSYAVEVYDMTGVRLFGEGDGKPQAVRTVKGRCNSAMTVR